MSSYFSAALEARTVSSTVQVAGTTVAYWTYEPVQATPETRTILVIHGFRGDHHGLLRVADQLPGMRIIMPDLPGFGSSAAFAYPSGTTGMRGTARLSSGSRRAPRTLGHPGVLGSPSPLKTLPRCTPRGGRIGPSG